MPTANPSMSNIPVLSENLISLNNFDVVYNTQPFWFLFIWPTIVTNVYHINQHCCIFLDQQCQRSAWAEFHSISDQYQIKGARDPITRSVIKRLLSGRTQEWDKIQKDLFSFVSWLPVPYIAPQPLSPFPSRSSRLWNKLTLFQRAEDRSHSV